MKDNKRGPDGEIKLGISHSSLHIIAMLLMLCDHAGCVLFPGEIWMRYVGRLSFPIFCFMLSEGFYHTRDIKKYWFRLLIFAVLSEIPFNLAFENKLVWKQNNVMWTFLIALSCLIVLDKIHKWVKDKQLKVILNIVLSLLVICFFAYLGDLLETDYAGPGVLQVVLFYYVNKVSNKYRIVGYGLQLLGMLYINAILLGGLYRTHELFGLTFKLHLQTYALLSLVFIWLYNKQKGIRGPVFKQAVIGSTYAYVVIIFIKQAIRKREIMFIISIISIVLIIGGLYTALRAFLQCDEIDNIKVQIMSLCGLGSACIGVGMFVAMILVKFLS